MLSSGCCSSLVGMWYTACSPAWPPVNNLFAATTAQNLLARGDQAALLPTTDVCPWILAAMQGQSPQAGSGALSPECHMLMMATCNERCL